jgi:Ca2+:H+ antiporter
MTISKNTPWAWIAFPARAILFVIVSPVLGIGRLPLTSPASLLSSAVMIVIMMGTVFAAVYHAELIAVRVGEPFGTLVLTLAVTVIEVALIASLLLMPNASATLARDTVFAVVMIVCNGLVGLCVLVGGIRYREQEFKTEGTGVYLIVLATVAVLGLVLPNYTLTASGPYFSTAQLVFVSIIIVLLYGVFLFIQTVRHTEYFVQPKPSPSRKKAYVPEDRAVFLSSGLLLVALAGVILIAKKFAVVLEAGLDLAGAPQAAAGVIIAMVVLAPESISAVGAAQQNMLPKSLNLALGSSLATIGLTIPAVAITSIFLGKGMALGLGARDTLLLALTLFISLLTFGTGRTNSLYGLVHLVVFAAFLFLTFIP